MKNAFADSFTRPQFAGHETFPLRLLWLKKAFDAVVDGAASGTFQEQNAIARFGVGRNMAVAMRYWALASGFIEEKDRVLGPSKIGRIVLSDDGYDPYLERAATIWLAHWSVAREPSLTTTAYYVFNALSTLEFDPPTLLGQMETLVEQKGWRATKVTLKRDIEVFLRSYVRRSDGQLDDAAEPLLAELGLIREARFGGWFEFVHGPKPSLPDGIFAYALSQFWEERGGGASALTAERICYEVGSPGRVFKLDEDSVITRLMSMESLTGGAWVWTDTAGLRQIQRVGTVEPLDLVSVAYGRRQEEGVA